MYRLLTAGVDDATPIRFVIWSWPSAQVRGQLRDVRTKANRTELAGYCLAWVLTHLPETQQVSLLGYSFGARIATGAMHLVGGGELVRTHAAATPGHVAKYARRDDGRSAPQFLAASRRVSRAGHHRTWTTC